MLARMMRCAEQITNIEQIAFISTAIAKVNVINFWMKTNDRNRQTTTTTPPPTTAKSTTTTTSTPARQITATSASAMMSAANCSEYADADVMKASNDHVQNDSCHWYHHKVKIRRQSERRSGGSGGSESNLCCMLYAVVIYFLVFIIETINCDQGKCNFRIRFVL